MVNAAKEANLTQEIVREAFDFNPDNGYFRHRARFSRGCLNARLAGKIAGRINPTSGYRDICIGAKFFLAHRLVWFVVHGEWPATDVDHINRNKDDNRPNNLRLASRSQNMINIPPTRANTSGVKGVTFDKRTGRWRAGIGIDYKWLHIGMFATLEDAKRARRDVEVAQFGEFAA